MPPRAMFRSGSPGSRRERVAPLGRTGHPLFPGTPPGVCRWLHARFSNDQRVAPLARTERGSEWPSLDRPMRARCAPHGSTARAGRAPRPPLKKAGGNRPADAKRLPGRCTRRGGEEGRHITAPPPIAFDRLVALVRGRERVALPELGQDRGAGPPLARKRRGEAGLLELRGECPETAGEFHSSSLAGARSGRPAPDRGRMPAGSQP